MPEYALILLRACGLLLLLAGGWVLLLEGQPFLGGGPDAEAKFEAVLNREVGVGLSLPAVRLALDDCVVAAGSFYGLAQPTVRRRAFMEGCRSIAETAARANPTYSYAHLVAALAAAELDDEAGLNVALDLSYRTGRNEQWVAERRVSLVETYRDRVDGGNSAAHDADLAMLVASRQGIKAIARRYLEQQDFRERITAIVETLPDALQRKFVGTVRAEAGT